MLIVDANILVSAVLGRSRPFIEATVARGVDLFVTEAQLEETRRVLVGKLAIHPRFVDRQLALLTETVRVLESALYAPLERAARDRLHPRGQPDWPTLAAAMALDAGVWSKDLDFFGTGVAVWATRNVRHAAAQADPPPHVAAP